MTAIQQVSIVDLQERPEPKPHTVYRIEIKAHIQSWSMWRRYSEFDDLHTDLVQANPAPPPPAPLPPKHKFSLFRSRTDSQLLTERRAGLETYLRAIISARDDQWREAYPFKQFLGIPIGKAAAAKNVPTHFSSTSWLDEYQEIQTRLRDVRGRHKPPRGVLHPGRRQRLTQVQRQCQAETRRRLGSHWHAWEGTSGACGGWHESRGAAETDGIWLLGFRMTARSWERWLPSLE